MKEMKTKKKAKFIMPEIIVINNQMWAPRVALMAGGNQLMLEPIISLDEKDKK